MRLSDMLGIRAGDCVTVIGAGGKSALIRRLAKEWPRRVVIVATGQQATGCEPTPQPQGLTLVETGADHLRPLIGWADNEPAVPPSTTLTIAIVSARAVGLPATAENVFNLPCFLAQSGLREGDIVDEDALARVILWALDKAQTGRRALVINQADDEALLGRALKVAAQVRFPVIIGSMQTGNVWSAN